MYYGRKKAVIIAIIVAIVVVVLAAVGAFVVLKTDLFKSEQKLFWKYAGIETEKMNIPQIATSQLKDVEKMKEQSPYKTNAELTFEASDEEVNEVLKNISFTMGTEKNAEEEYASANIKAKYSGTELLNVDFAQNEKFYALKSDEIVTAYIGIKNENLKQLARKLGITDTSVVPDEIEFDTITELFDIPDNLIAHVKDTYGNFIYENIPETAYSKQTEATLVKDGVSYNTTSYRMEMSADLVCDLETKLLNKVQQDDMIINFIIEKASILGYEINSDDVTESIQDMIDDIDIDKAKDISYVVYSYKGNTLATEILIKNEQKMTVYQEDGKIRYILEDLTGDAELEKVEMDITYKFTSVSTAISVSALSNGNEFLSFSMQSDGSATQGSVETVIEAKISNPEIEENEDEDEEYYTATLKHTIEFVDEIEDKVVLDANNSVALNDYSAEDLEVLVQAIAYQITNVYTQKLQLLGMNNLLTNPSAYNSAMDTIENTETDSEYNEDYYNPDDYEDEEVPELQIDE